MRDYLRSRVGELSVKQPLIIHSVSSTVLASVGDRVLNRPPSPYKSACGVSAHSSIAVLPLYLSCPSHGAQMLVLDYFKLWGLGVWCQPGVRNDKIGIGLFTFLHSSYLCFPSPTSLSFRISPLFFPSVSSSQPSASILITSVIQKI